MKRIFIILFFLLIFNMCEDIVTNDQLDTNVVVNLILNPDSSKQVALLSYTEEIRTKSRNILLINDAEFFVNDIKFNSIPSDSFSNNLMCNSNNPEIKNCFNYYSVTKQLIKEGENILKVKIDNKILTGKTVVPGNFTVTLKGKNLFWSSSSNTTLYRVSAIYQGDWDYLQPFEETTIDTFITLDIKDFTPGLYKIKVEAIDANFYNYSIKKDFHAGLENAYGVFGSVRVKQLLQIIN